MGTRRSQHNRGRKPFYKEHRLIAAHLLENPRAGGWRGWTRTHWHPADELSLGILCEADASIEGAADALGRSPSSIAHRARDTGLTLPREWSRLIQSRKATWQGEKTPKLNYPYITKARDEHADLLAINAIVPPGLPDHARSDICQNILLAVYEGRVTIAALQQRPRSATYYIKKFYKENYEDGGFAISFNATGDDWDEDAVASRLAADEWRFDQDHILANQVNAFPTYTRPTQFEAAWRDQVSRHQLRLADLGQFLSEDEVEQMLSESDNG